MPFHPTHRFENKDPESKIAEIPRSVQLIQVSLDCWGCIRTINPAGAELFGRSQEELRGKDFHELLIQLQSDWIDLIPRNLYKIVDKPFFLPWDSGRKSGLGWNVEALPSGAGRLDGLFISLVPGLAPEVGTPTPEWDLNCDLKQTVHSLFFRTQQVEGRFRQFMRLLPGLPYSQNRDLTFAYYNEQLRFLIGEGLTKQLIEGEAWTDWIHPEDRAEFDQNLTNCLSYCSPVAVRYRLKLPDSDRILYLLDIRIPVRGLCGQVTGFEGLWLDLTRQTLAEGRLQRAAWKESLAEISGSMAHDFNNILTGIVNLSDLMYKSKENNQVTFRYDIKIIRDTALQAQHIIQRIISLNREKSGEIKLHNLVEIVSQQTDLLRIVLPRHVQLHVEVPEGEIPVMLDQSAIRRVLLNFTTNAKDALSYGGEVTLSVKRVDLSSYSRTHLMSTRCGEVGPAAELVFKDNGCGIDPKILHRIFDPYFSTKEANRGSGLGLYSMTQFAQENGFDFGVRSVLGEGTEMYLLIPVEQIDLSQPEADATAGRRAVHEPKRQTMTKVGIFAEMSDSILNLTRAFIGEGIDVDNLENVANACQWLKEGPGGREAIILFMDHRKILPAELKAELRSAKGQLKRILCFHGFNPDEISHVLGDVVDHLFEAHSHPSENLKSVLKHLDSGGPSNPRN